MFEFIEAKCGKEGIRQFLFSLRKSVIGGGEDAYEEALQDEEGRVRPGIRALPEGPVQAVPRQGAAGRLRPRPGAEPREDAVRRGVCRSRRRRPAICIAVVTVNRKDRELDIVLSRPKDGSVVRNLTRGFDKDLGFDHIVQPGGVGGNAMPVDGVVAEGRPPRLLRPHRERDARSSSQNVLTRKIEERIPMKTVDEPESPAFSPDGQTVAFAALRSAVGDIFTVDLDDARGHQPHQRRFRRLGADLLARRQVHRLQRAGQRQREAVPPRLSTRRRRRRSPSARTTRRRAQFIDDHTIVFSSTATDPAVPLEPEVARRTATSTTSGRST